MKINSKRRRKRPLEGRASESMIGDSLKPWWGNLFCINWDADEAAECVEKIQIDLESIEPKSSHDVTSAFCAVLVEQMKSFSIKIAIIESWNLGNGSRAIKFWSNIHYLNDTP